MNREIKFQFWHTVHRIMFPVIGIGFVDSWVTVEPTPDSECMWDLTEGHLRQFTGLTDKNGVEWFEGDIVRGQYGEQMSDKSVEQIGVIEFWQGRFEIHFPVKTVGLSDTNLDATCYWAATVKWPTERTQGYQITGLEIIGNRFENPELLETN